MCCILIAGVCSSLFIGALVYLSTKMFTYMFAFLFGGLYMFFDVNYFIRTLWTLVLARLLKFRKIKFEDESVTYGICLPSDVDFGFTHMNNARFLREMDFGRFDFYERCGLFSRLLKAKANFPAGAISIRYRKPLYIFNPYRIRTKVLWWDSKSLYVQQELETLDGFVRSVAMVRQAIVGSDWNDLIGQVTGTKPNTPPPELTKWIESNDLSSQNLKKIQ